MSLLSKPSTLPSLFFLSGRLRGYINYLESLISSTFCNYWLQFHMYIFSICIAYAFDLLLPLFCLGFPLYIIFQHSPTLSLSYMYWLLIPCLFSACNMFHLYPTNTLLTHPITSYTHTPAYTHYIYAHLNNTHTHTHWSASSTWSHYKLKQLAFKILRVYIIRFLSCKQLASSD